MQHLCRQGQAHLHAGAQVRTDVCGTTVSQGADTECLRSGTILPGITRKSIIELARQRGYDVQERAVTIEEAVDADELFCTVRHCQPCVQ